jgi:UDP-2-acetamido-3-amino-2,3-dideoxy-glucuronate N-acetyltransferase
MTHEQFVHPTALCESANVGRGTKVCAFAHVAQNASIGPGTTIGIRSNVGAGAELGAEVIIEAGAQIGARVRLEDQVCIGENATVAGTALTDDERPEPSTVIRSGASVGAGSTISPGVTIGPSARVLCGAVVTRSVPSNAIVSGNPAQIIGYVNAVNDRASAAPKATPGVRTTTISGVTVHQMVDVEDLRGNLSVGELGRDVPFEVKRYFLVFDVPNMEIRGEHAHVRCHQFLLCVKGSLNVVADDGQHRQEFILDRPGLGLYLPPMICATQYRYSPDAVLLVLASEHYDASDYIRDHDVFQAMVRTRPQP